MNIHFYMLFTLTFCTGMMAGAVLYVGAFAPTQQPAGPAPVSERNFELRGERFAAGCLDSAAGCDQITLQENRRLERIENGADQATVRVSSAYFRTLESELALTELEDIQRESVDCQSYQRIGTQYLLIYEGEVYTLHSCSEQYQDSALPTLLEELWDGSVATTSAPLPVFEEGVTGVLQEYLREQFSRSSE